MPRLSEIFPAGYRPALEQEVRSSMEGQDGLLHNMLLYQLGGVDEHGTYMPSLSVECLHPYLCLLACESLCGEFPPALIPAAAVELVHQYALMHEDVQAGSPNRGHRPTVWWIWGPGQAINAGDGMHAMARITLMRLHQRGTPVDSVLKAMQLLDRSSLALCEGQHMDLAFQERLDPSVDFYERMAERKSGALVACAMGLGALTAAEDESVVAALHNCGREIGTAWQMAQDIRDLAGSTGQDGPSDSLLNKKKLLPIVRALESGEPSLKRELGTMYFKRILDPEDVHRMVEILEEASAMEFSRKLLESRCEKAVDALSGAPVSSTARATLERLLQEMMDEA
jgi:geranylgeranyl diphosphate synthase type I